MYYAIGCRSGLNDSEGHKVTCGITPHPLPYVECPPFFQCHNYSHIFTHNSKTTRSIFVKFWEIAKNNMTVMNLK